MADEIKREQEQPVDNTIEDGKIFAVVGYIGILCLLPLLLKKDNKFALHHGKQGLVIFIGAVIAGFLPILPLIGLILSPILFLVLIIYSIIGIVQSASGKYWDAPVVADIAKKINL
jgi:uncharacterized membrane protein